MIGIVVDIKTQYGSLDDTIENDGRASGKHALVGPIMVMCT